MQMKDFLQCIQKKETPKSDGALGVKVVRILEAAQKSLTNKGMWTEINNATAT